MAASFPYQQPLALLDDFAPFSARPEPFDLDFSDLCADFTDSAPSPHSPPMMSPVFSGSYALPVDDGWAAWDAKAEQPPYNSAEDSEVDLSLFREPASFGTAGDTSLTSPDDDAVVFGCEGVNDTQPLFQFDGPAGRQYPQEPRSLSSPSSPPPLVSSRSASFFSPTTGQTKKPGRQPERARRYPARSRKRKSPSVSDAEDEGGVKEERINTLPRPPLSPPSASPPLHRRKTTSTAPKKTAHNMIEKRYRNNLNDKIAALRDAVPALRVAARQEDSDDESVVSPPETKKTAPRRRARAAADDDDDELGGLAPAHKLNKATILGKATEYIAHLERQNQKLARENSALRSRVDGLEKVVGSGRLWGE